MRKARMQLIAARSKNTVVVMQSEDGASFTPWREMSRRTFTEAGGVAKLREVCARKGIFFSVIGSNGMEATNAK